jgi:prepilin signal peptidase PulO-like enzyme (type II secretory pathway)
MARGAYIPFGPFLSLGAVVAMLYGTEILGWYGTLLSEGR